MSLSKTEVLLTVAGMMSPSLYSYAPTKKRHARLSSQAQTQDCFHPDCNKQRQPKKLYCSAECARSHQSLKLK